MIKSILMTRLSDKWLSLVAGSAIFLITLGIYVPATRCGFVWDDDQLLTANPLIRAPDGLCRIWFTSDPPDYFPLVSTAFWVEWRIWGMNPAGYHLINILLHAAASILLWRVLKRLAIPGAWLTGLIFAVHPVNVESVAWIAQLKNTLPMVFYLLTVLAYLQFEDTDRRRWYAIAIGLFLLALLSKTSVVMLPVVLLGLAWWRRGKIGRADVARSIPLFAMSLMLGLVTVWFQYHQAGAATVRTDGFGSRLAVAGHAVWFYLSKALVPSQLTFVYPGWDLDPLNSMSFAPAAALGIGLGVFWLKRGTWGRPFLAGFGYFVVTLLPVLGFLNIYFMRYSPVADHWQYISIAGPIALTAGILVRAIESPSMALRRGAGAIAAVWISLLAVHTWYQQDIYKDNETLWRDTILKNPRAHLAHNNLGLMLFENGNLAGARDHYEEALRLRPVYPEARTNLGNLLARLGDLETAAGHYREVIAVDPDNFGAHYNLAIALARQDKLGESLAHFSEALRIDPESESAKTGRDLVRAERARRESMK